MFVKYDDKSIRLTGRWAKQENEAVTTTTGSQIFIKFEGDMAVLKFDIMTDNAVRSHLWISVDGGAMIESEVDAAIRIKTADYGIHTIRVIYKSQLENFNRWTNALTQKITFIGVEVDKPVEIEADTRKTIEFVGDSITEGILVDDGIDVSRKAYINSCEYNRVYVNDVCGTYAWRTAENLNLSPIIMGYGAVGVTKGGNGGVPAAYEAYNYNYAGNPICHESADYIVINHGANDSRATAEEYVSCYSKLLDVVRAYNKTSKIFVLSAFCGVHPKELKTFVEKYNAENGTNIVFIDSTGWVPREPLHPLRDGHKIISEHLTEILKEYID